MASTYIRLRSTLYLAEPSHDYVHRFAFRLLWMLVLGYCALGEYCVAMLDAILPLGYCLTAAIGAGLWLFAFHGPSSLEGITARIVPAKRISGTIK